MFMFHRGPLQVVEGISRFAKLNRGALEQLKFVALWQKTWNMKTDFEGETPAGYREFRINTLNSLYSPRFGCPKLQHLSFFSGILRESAKQSNPERIGTTCSEPHRPSRRVIVESSAAGGSMRVDGLWNCWIRLAVLQFLVWFSGKWAQCLEAFHFWFVFGIMVESFSVFLLPQSWKTVEERCVLTRGSTWDGNKNAT